MLKIVLMLLTILLPITVISQESEDSSQQHKLITITPTPLDPDDENEYIESQAKRVLKYKYNYDEISNIVSLDPPAPEKNEDVHKHNREGGSDKPALGGFNRPIPPPHDKNIDLSKMTWIPLPSGGKVTAFSFTSPGAHDMTLHIVISKMKDGIEMRFFDPVNQEESYGPFTSKEVYSLQDEKEYGFYSKNDYGFYSVDIVGDTIAVEVYIPASLKEQDLSFRVPLLTHGVDIGADDSSMNTEESIEPTAAITNLVVVPISMALEEISKEV